MFTGIIQSISKVIKVKSKLGLKTIIINVVDLQIWKLFLKNHQAYND